MIKRHPLLFVDLGLLLGAAMFMLIVNTVVHNHQRLSDPSTTALIYVVDLLLQALHLSLLTYLIGQTRALLDLRAIVRELEDDDE